MRPRKLNWVQEAWVRSNRGDCTLREMAKLLGVSKATICRTLRPQQRIETKIRYVMREQPTCH